MKIISFVLVFVLFSPSFLHPGLQIFDDTPPSFSKGNLVAPEFVPYSQPFEIPPVPSQDFYPIVNCKLQPIIIGEIYARFGGAAHVYLQNNDPMDFQKPSSDLFILNISIVWHNSIKTTKPVQKYVNAGNKSDLGIWNFKAPDQPGKYLYNFEITAFARDAHTNQWAGPRNISFKESEIEVVSLGNYQKNEVVKNEKEIYGKINSLSKPTALVNSKIEELKKNSTSTYTTALLLEIFEYACTINYSQEPSGVDYWQSPDETISRASGDCEDFAILISSLVSGAGGTARFAYTSNHAFAIIYIGTNFTEIQSAVNLYYHHNLNMVFFEDEFGYWVIADPAGEPYLGGLPVSGIPCSEKNGTWLWYLNSSYIGIIDITLLDYTSFSQYLPYIYIAVILTLSTLSLVVIYVYSKPVCAQCEMRIKKDVVAYCPVCGAPYHNTCLSSLYFCKKCNAHLQEIPVAERTDNQIVGNN
ncbi:MAG: transglutaminase domain-containing protein [Thermoplasmata archaeon]